MRVVLATLVLLVAGCGDDSDADLGLLPDASCAMQDLQPAPSPDGGPASACVGSPCGGDLTGTWQVVALCATGTGDASYLGCKTGTLTYAGEAVTGTFTFAADGTVTSDAAEHFVGLAHLPLSCYTALGVDSCAAITSLASAKGIQAACVPACTSDDACDCSIDLSGAAKVQGTIVTDGAGNGTLTLGKEVIPAHYCVTGDELWVQGTRFGSVDYRYRMRRVL